MLKTKKPKSKLVILDPKKAFSKQPVFTEAFDKYYKGIVELNLSTDIDDFSVTNFDGKAKRDHHQGGQEGEVRRGQRHPAAAGRLHRARRRRHGWRLGAGQPGDHAVQGEPD